MELTRHTHGVEGRPARVLETGRDAKMQNCQRALGCGAGAAWRAASGGRLSGDTVLRDAKTLQGSLVSQIRNARESTAKAHSRFETCQSRD